MLLLLLLLLLLLFCHTWYLAAAYTSSFLLPHQSKLLCSLRVFMSPFTHLYGLYSYSLVSSCLAILSCSYEYNHWFLLLVNFFFYATTLSFLFFFLSCSIIISELPSSYTSLFSFVFTQDKHSIFSRYHTHFSLSCYHSLSFSIVIFELLPNPFTFFCFDILPTT